MKARLILEDGHVFEGESFGAVHDVISEFVFNTAMTGYVEVLTDPSYAGQSVVMTYPLIGNCGVPLDDQEAAHPFVEAFVVSELSRLGSNFRMNMSLNDYMIENNIPGIQGVDTRAITRILRKEGCMNGMITTKDYEENTRMPKRDDIKKVLVIGSGPIIIGQAAEFDYAGTQACRALREEGIEVVLINSNPATIMTDGDMADHVYIEPLTVPVVKQLIEKEKPDALLPTMGGQNALNIAMALADEGFLEKHHVKTIGTDTDTIKMAEDRLEFKNLMERIGEPVAKSVVVNYVEDAIAFAKEIGYPVVVRPAYTLGGTGGGIAHNKQELHEICSNGLRLSRVTECLIEQSIAGWKEVEYEVMRDGAGNCITVCNMENMDPVGVHTGDSIVVAPSQTLSDKDYQMLRSSALNIITALNIKGGCNVQFALNPDSFEYCVIEVNPRVSRSSALASKATGYPIAKLATKIALGYNLDEIVNAVTGKTYASYEPTLDYIVCKIPKWPFDKFYDASRKLGTQMKATGEVMAICNNFEGAFMKALRSLEQDSYYLYNEEIAQLSADDLRKDLRKIDDKRAFRIAEALRKGVSIQEIHAITKIDVWFIDKIKHLVEIEDRLKNEELTPDLLKLAKHCEFPDRVIASLTGKTADEVYYLRKGLKITAAFKTVDTCAAEFDAEKTGKDLTRFWKSARSTGRRGKPSLRLKKP